MPLTNALGTTKNVRKPTTAAAATSTTSNNTAQQQQQAQASTNNSPVLANRKIKQKSSPKREIQKDIQVPANVDEVAMIHNIKEETEHYNSTENNQALVSFFKCIFNS